jgi:hypothetical protein
MQFNSQIKNKTEQVEGHIIKEIKWKLISRLIIDEL